METENIVVGQPEAVSVGNAEAFDMEAAQEAVEAAIAAEESGADPDAAVEAVVAKKEPAKAEATPAESDLLSASQLKKVLAAREAKVRAIQEANNEKQAILAEVAKQRAEAERMIAEAKAEKEYWRKLKANPEEGLRLMGVDPEQFLMDIANSASPEAKLQAQLRAQREELQRFQAQQEALEKQRQEQALRAQTHQEIQFRDSIEQKFMSSIEAGTYAKALYGHQPEVLIAWGDKIAQEYRAATAAKFGTPKEATVEQIAEYIEEQSQLRYNSLKLESGKVGNSVVGSKSPSGKAAKTLSQTDSSEKRATGRNLEDLSDEERRLAAIEEVERAILQSESNQK